MITRACFEHYTTTGIDEVTNLGPAKLQPLKCTRSHQPLQYCLTEDTVYLTRRACLKEETANQTNDSNMKVIELKNCAQFDHSGTRSCTRVQKSFIGFNISNPSILLFALAFGFRFKGLQGRRLQRLGDNSRMMLTIRAVRHPAE